MENDLQMLGNVFRHFEFSKIKALYNCLWTQDNCFGLCFTTYLCMGYNLTIGLFCIKAKSKK